MNIIIFKFAYINILTALYYNILRSNLLSNINKIQKKVIAKL